MSFDGKIEQRVRQLKDTTSAELDRRVLAKAKQTLRGLDATSSIMAGSRSRPTMSPGSLLKPALVAVALLILLGAFTFWPNQSSPEKSWWLGPSAAWGQEILDTLGQIKGVTCRERTAVVWGNGPEHISSTWDRYYASSDSYRRDIYDGDGLREIQWYTPDANGMRQTSVRFDLKSYFIELHQGSFGNTDPVKRMRRYVRYLDQAKTLLGEKEIDGHPCVGFEISASQYGDNPERRIDRIWFDVDTRLPVRIENSGWSFTDEPESNCTTLKDQFDYDPELPTDTFVPSIPEGYIHAHPDEIMRSR